MMTYDAFNVLDEVFHLVPEQDLENGHTYVWVCNFSGGRFYTEVVEDNIWLNNGI